MTEEFTKFGTVTVTNFKTFDPSGVEWIYLYFSSKPYNEKYNEKYDLFEYSFIVVKSEYIYVPKKAPAPKVIIWGYTDIITVKFKDQIIIKYGFENLSQSHGIVRNLYECVYDREKANEFLFYIKLIQ